MYLRPQYNFEINFAEVSDSGPDSDAWHEGLFDMVLNNRLGVYIRFIPAIPGLEETWPPTEAVYSDTTPSGLRKQLLLEAEYVVMPSEQWQGTTRTIGTKDAGGNEAAPEGMAPVVVFFVAPAEFDLYCAERERLCTWESEEQAKAGRNLIEDLGPEYRLPAFIKDRMIQSPYLEDRALYCLKRKRLADGTVVPEEEE